MNLKTGVNKMDNAKKITEVELAQYIIGLGLKSLFIHVVYTCKQGIFNKGRGKNSMLNTIGINPDEITRTSNEILNVGSTFENKGKLKLKKLGANPDLWKSQGLPPHMEHVEGYITKYVGSNEDCIGRHYLVIYDYQMDTKEETYDYAGESIDVSEKKFDSYRVAPKKPSYYKDESGKLILDENDQPIKKVPYKNYSFDGIDFISINGEKFEVTH